MEVVKSFVRKLDFEAEQRAELSMLGNRHERRSREAEERSRRNKRRNRAKAK